MAKILFLDDDDLTLGVLLRAFDHAAGESAKDHEVVRVYSEADFGRGLRAGHYDDVDLFVLDANVTWAEASTARENPPPLKVDRSDSFAAGLRCAQLVLDRKATGNRPLFLFTVTPQRRIEESAYADILKYKNVHLRAKSESFNSFAFAILNEAQRPSSS